MAHPNKKKIDPIYEIMVAAGLLGFDSDSSVGSVIPRRRASRPITKRPLASPSEQMASVEHEFAILDAARKRLEYLKHANKAQSDPLAGMPNKDPTPVIDWEDVIKQGLRNKDAVETNRVDVGYTNLSPEARVPPAISHHGPAFTGKHFLGEGYGGTYQSDTHKVTVDPNKYGNTTSLLQNFRGRSGPHPERVFTGDEKRGFPLPKMGYKNPLIEAEIHELAHRAAWTIYSDPLFMKIYNESQASGENLLKDFYSDRPTVTVPYGNKTITRKGRPYALSVDDNSREHKMIRAATEGSDPSVDVDQRYWHNNLGMRNLGHSKEAIQDAKDFNILVKRYWAAKQASKPPMPQIGSPHREKLYDREAMAASDYIYDPLPLTPYSPKRKKRRRKKREKLEGFFDQPEYNK